MTNATVTLTQHPVGQGGMMSGMLESDQIDLHWVYDCGSNQVEALDRSIQNVAASKKIDILFISHLDKDHVHGVDTLLGLTDVTEVVLPYLDSVSKLLVAASAASSGGLTATLASLITDPVGWFAARGVERVTFIQPDDDDGDEIGGIEIPDGPADGEGPFKWGWTNGVFGPRAPKDAPDSWLPLGSAVAIPSIDWVLIPYAHKPSDAKLLKFRQALNATFGATRFNKDVVASIVRDKSKRKKLRQCYEAIWKNHNLVSMALYAGPRSGSRRWHLACVPRQHWHHCCLLNPAREAGWLLTGDMHLDVNVRRSRFFDFYRPFLEHVNVFGLPHHGSRHNFDLGLLSPMPNMTQAVAASGPNSYGHPSPWVRDCVESTGREFLKVSERGNSILIWKHTS